jgi:LAO/AO transport system kinase
MPFAINAAQLADPTQLGRLLSLAAGEGSAGRELLAALPPASAPAHRIGVTGSPGVGKSTLLSSLIKELRGAGHRVGVIAVDPTSPFSGGALLGDRLRITSGQDDPDVFIRSLGSRGSLGGVTPGASAVAAVLEAAGYDRILIETVGVGQTGYDVICLADTVVALFSPESGDGVQLLKAGILEVGDIFAVNKCDRPGADLMLKEIRFSLELGVLQAGELIHHGPLPAETTTVDAPAALSTSWSPPVLALAAQQGTGVAELAAALAQHQAWLASLPADHPRRRQRLVRELAFVMRAQVSTLLDRALAGELDALAAQVLAGRLELWQAVEQLRARLRVAM